MTRFETFGAAGPTAAVRLSRIEVPGSDKSFTFTRDGAGGTLLRVASGDRVYIETDPDGWTRLDCGLGRFRDHWDETCLYREVETPFGSWREVYGFDPDGKVTHVDGVDIHRDDQGRVTACLGQDVISHHRWFYSYTGEGLVSIQGPQGTRHLSRLDDGRVIASRLNGEIERFAYDGKGRQRGAVPLSRETHHRDEAGRIWSVTDPDGQVLHTFIWDGWRCIGRIDGPPGAPLTAAFSLDPGATPVRVLTARGVRRIPRDAYGEGLTAHPGTPGLFGAFQSGGHHHLPWRILNPGLASFTAPDPFDGTESDPRRGPNAEYEGELNVDAEHQRPYDVCRNDPISHADPSGGVSAGLMISSLTWSFQNNLLTFFGIDWWFNLFGSMFTGSNFFSSEQLTASDHIGALGVRRDGVISKITGGRAFTTQHIVWDTAESFDSLLDGMVIDPNATFDPPLRGGPLLAVPAGRTPFVLRGNPGDAALDWNRSGGTATPSFPGASQPVFPAGGFHLTQTQLNVRGPRACPLTELVPGESLTTGTEDDADRQDFWAWETTVPDTDLPPMGAGNPILLAGGGERFRTRLVTFGRRWVTGGFGGRVDFTVEDHVPDEIPTTGLTATRLSNATTREVAQAPGGGVQGFSGRGLTENYPPNDLLEIRPDGGGDEVTFCQATGLEARLPLNDPAPAAMTSPISVVETTLAPPVSVTLDGADGIEFPASATPPATQIIGLVTDGTTHIPVRITDDTASPVLRTDATLSGLGAPGDTVSFRLVTAAGLLGRRMDPVEAAAQITYVPNLPGRAPDGSSDPVVVLLSGAGALPDAPRLVTGAPDYDAVLTDAVIAGAAPWSVEKWSLAPGFNAIPGVAYDEDIAVTPDDPAQLTNALAVRVLSVGGAANVPARNTNPLTSLTGGVGLTMTGATGTHVDTLANMPNAPRVSNVVILEQGAADTQASLSGLHLTFSFDRPVPIVADTENIVVRLRRAGFEWTANPLANDRIVLTPMVGGTRGQFPRVREGAPLRVAWEVGGVPDVRIYRVTAVEGLTLTLDGPVAVPTTPDAGTLTAQLLEADNPGTGHQKIAINLSRADAAADTEAEADVWTPDAFAPVLDAVGTLFAGGELGYGIVSDGVTTPVVIDDTAQQTLSLTFASNTGLNGPTNLHTLDVLQQFDVPVTRALTEPLVVTDSTTDLEVVILQPFVPSPSAAAGAMLEGGDVIIPSEEGVEITRRQALVDHELAHTEQYHKFGPIWFCYFPLFIAELPVEFTTDLDQPEYGPSIPATLERSGSRVQIVPQSDVGVQAEDQVQLLQGGDHETLTVASLGGTTLVMQGASNMRAGAVQVRRARKTGIWSEVLLNISRVTSHGGLLNTVVGFTWGGLLWLLSKGIYGIAHAIGRAGDRHPGTIVDAGRAITLDNDDGRRDLNADGQYIIQSGDRTVVRTATRSDDRLELDQPIADLTGAVQVAAYATYDPYSAFDWLRYHAGTVDGDNAAAIDLPGRGGGFTVGDRIEYIYLDRSDRTHITAITGDRIEIEAPVPLQGEERSVRVALLAEAGTTLANADEAALNWMGMGWMRLLFDPYGQIEARIRPQETWAVVLLRIMRVIMGSRNWSALPLLGYVFWARLFGIIPEHRAKIEQDASERSGDLYTPLSRLEGEVDRPDRYGETSMSVGDIARFRYWPWTGVRDLSSIGNTGDGGNMGAPGLHLNNRGLLRVIINRVGGPNAAMPNQRMITNVAGAYPPSLGLPDALFTKNYNANLGAQPDPTDIGIVPADLGAVPLSPSLVRNPSSYVAFSRPGSHRATIANGNFASIAAGLNQQDGDTEALDAQNNQRQNIWFNVTARDVAVTVNGADVAEGATVTLVQTQTARINVETTGRVPNVARTFRATVAGPTTSNVLRAPDPLRLVAQGTNTGGTPELVEISRFYDFDPDSGSYSDAALARFGTMLGGDLDIPVRSFDIEITDQLVLRAAADPAAAEVTTLTQGDSAFVLIPTSAGEVANYIINGNPSSLTDPILLFETVETPVAAADNVGALGQVRRVRFPEALPVPSTATIEIAIPVTGEDGNVGTLRLSFDLDPPA